MTKRRSPQQVTLEERQNQALRKLYHYEYAVALTLSISALRRRDEYLTRKLERPHYNDIDRACNEIRQLAIRDAGTVRGLYTPENTPEE